MHADYIDSPQFAALHLSPAQVAAAKNLPKVFSQIFWNRQHVWLAILNRSMVPKESPQDCGVRFECSDAGRKEAGFKERRDCTVRAVAHVLDLSYSEAHSKLSALGRQLKRGVVFREPTFAGPLGLELCPELGCRRLSSILPELRSGRYIVRIRGHVFAVIHGVIKDTIEVKQGSAVRAVYRLKGVAS